MEWRGKKSRLTTMFLRMGIHCNDEQKMADSGKDIKFTFQTSLRHSDGEKSSEEWDLQSTPIPPQSISQTF